MDISRYILERLYTVIHEQNAISYAMIYSEL